VIHRLLAAAFAAFVVLVLAGPVAAKAPTRIVSLSPTATEDLFAIRAGSQVVAVDDQSDYPKSAPKTQLSGFTPNIEAIASYHPDLVVVQYDANGVVEGLRKLGIRVLVQPAAKTLADAYAQIRQLGAITGHRAAAQKLVAFLHGQKIQSTALRFGFRPADPSVPMKTDGANPFQKMAQYGFSLDVPSAAQPPEGSVVRNLLMMWNRVVKPK